MSGSPSWLPPKLDFSDCPGNTAAMLKRAYACFYKDLLVAFPLWNKKAIRCLRDPTYSGMENGFWHCVSEGSPGKPRVFDQSRCERIPWLLPVIRNSHDERVSFWLKRQGGELRPHFWLDESYLVVLADRGKYFFLVTTFVTDRTHTRDKKRRDRDEFRRTGKPV